MSIKNNNLLQISIILLLVFVVITIWIYNIYKGTKIVLPNLEDELKESSNFYLLKSIGWSFLITLLLAWFTLSDGTFDGKYAINKIVKI
jgi:hypothetical protein|tara:strand:+ start:386 stop:652 length:267 start_codon:yes stop_codon:yes gene_type:complete